MHEPLDILPRDRGNGHAAKLRFDVAYDPSAIGGERAGFLRRLTPRQQPTEGGYRTR